MRGNDTECCAILTRSDSLNGLLYQLSPIMKHDTHVHAKRNSLSSKDVVCRVCQHFINTFYKYLVVCLSCCSSQSYYSFSFVNEQVTLNYFYWEPTRPVGKAVSKSVESLHPVFNSEMKPTFKTCMCRRFWLASISYTYA